MSCAQSRFCSERCGPDSGKTDTVIQGGSLKSFQKKISFKAKRITKPAWLAPCLRFPQCTFVVTSNVSKLSQLRRIQKLQTPVVGIDYVFSCVEKGALLPVDEYRLDVTTTDSPDTPKSTSIIFLPVVSNEVRKCILFSPFLLLFQLNGIFNCTLLILCLQICINDAL